MVAVLVAIAVNPWPFAYVRCCLGAAYTCCSAACCGLRRTSLNAIMTAWQFGVRGSSPLSSTPSTKAVLPREGGLGRLRCHCGGQPDQRRAERA